MEFIKDFYYDHIKSTHKEFLIGTEYENLMGIKKRRKTILEERLSKQDMIEFQNYIDCIDELCLIISEENYASGFRDGARLMIDVLLGANRILRGSRNDVVKFNVY